MCARATRPHWTRSRRRATAWRASWRGPAVSHFHDEPTDHWAPPVSLDPTPVWKQYILAALLLLGSLVVIAAVAIPALLPSIVAPPASVIGGRVVLALADMPPVGGVPKRIDGPLVDADHTFYIAQVEAGSFVAVLEHWSLEEGAPSCTIAPIAPASPPRLGYATACPRDVAFGIRGEPINAPRSLARYLVSVDRDRVIVNVSREIREYGATAQPRVSPLGTR